MKPAIAQTIETVLILAVCAVCMAAWVYVLTGFVAQFFVGAK